MKNKKIKNLLAGETASIKRAMRIIDQGGLGIALVVDKDKKLLGIVTDGDVRRAVLKGISIEKQVGDIVNKNPLVLQNGKKNNLFSPPVLKEIKKRITLGGSLKIPVVNKKGEVEDVAFVHSDGKRVFWQTKTKPEERGAVKTVLLTGGAGYLGSVLCRQLLRKGYKVKVLDNLTYGQEGIKDLFKKKNFEFIEGDVRNISDITGAMEGADAVIHLAAIVGDPASGLDPKKTIEINYLSTKAVAEAAKFNQINRFLFVSTCSVYGASKNAKDQLKEDASLNPVSLYAETKIRSEEALLSLSDDNFMPTIFRFGTLYGASPRMRFDLVVNILTVRAVIAKKFSIFGGEQWRPNLEVSDAGKACLLWLRSPIEKIAGEVFNVGVNEQNCKIIEIGKIVKKAVPGAEMEVNQEAEDRRDYNVSFDKIRRVLGFKAGKTIEGSVKEMKQMIKKKKIKDFNLAKYSNYRFLSELSKGSAFK